MRYSDKLTYLLKQYIPDTMVIDDLTHLKDYTGLLPTLETVIRFLNSHDLQALSDGRFELDADGHFMNLQTIAPKASGQAVLEAHRQMIDIQIPLTGDEMMGYAPIGKLKAAPYDETKDISFYEEKPELLFTVKKGMFAIFFPQDAHAPGIASDTIKKAVFKIPVQTK